jgi:hypothetical protein
MNGRAILDAEPEKVGAAFRRSHRDRPFPLWLARALNFSSDDDPGHEDVWRDLEASLASGAVRVDFESGDAIGFLVHVTPFAGSIGKHPDGGWFERDANARTPTAFPLGIASNVPDPELRSFADGLLGREAARPEVPPANEVVEIIEAWTGDPLRKVPGELPLKIYSGQMFHLYWIAGLCADSPPRFELWVDAKGWTPPPSTAEYAVVKKSGNIVAIGPNRNLAGWSLWWTARDVASLLAELPDGAAVDFATTPRLDYNANLNPEVGRTLYSGVMTGGQFHIKEMSPVVGREVIDQALAFVLTIVRAWIMGTNDERTLLIDATEEVRHKFGQHWPVDRV